MQFTTLAVVLAAALGTSAAPAAAKENHCGKHYKWHISNYVNKLHGTHDIENSFHVEAPRCHGEPAFKAHCKSNAQDAGKTHCKGAKGLKYSFFQVDPSGGQDIDFTYKHKGKTFKAHKHIPGNVLTTHFTVKAKRTDGKHHHDEEQD